MEGIIPMTAGLLLDIFGVLLISQKFGLHHNIATRVKIALKEDEDKIDKHELSMYIDPRTHPTSAWNNKYMNIQWSDARIGFYFIVSGFFLILVASWVDYL